MFSHLVINFKKKVFKYFSYIKLFLSYPPKFNLIELLLDARQKSFNVDSDWYRFIFNEWILDTPLNIMISSSENKKLFLLYDSDFCFENWIYLIDISLNKINIKNNLYDLYCVYYIDQDSISPILSDEFGNYHSFLRCDVYFGSNVPEDTNLYNELLSIFRNRHKISLSLEYKILNSILYLEKHNPNKYSGSMYLNEKILFNSHLYKNQKRYYMLKICKNVSVLSKKQNKDLYEMFKLTPNEFIYKGVRISKTDLSGIKHLFNHYLITGSFEDAKADSTLLFNSTSVNNPYRISKETNSIFQFLKNETDSLYICSSYKYSTKHVLSGTVWNAYYLESLGFKLSKIHSINVDEKAFKSQFYKVKTLFNYKPNIFTINFHNINEHSVSMLDDQSYDVYKKIESEGHLNDD